MDSAPRSIADDVIAAFGGLAKTARALGHRHMTTVDGWRRSKRVPGWRWPEIVAGAEREGVTLPASVRAAAGMPPSPEQPVESQVSEQAAGEGAGSQSETDRQRVDTLKGQPKAA